MITPQDAFERGADPVAGVSADRRSVGIPTPASEAIVAARVRAVGTAFLRWRPIIVAPIIVAQVVLMRAMNLPDAQRAWLSAAMVLLLSLFAVEAWLVRQRHVTERWLLCSLASTAAGLACGMALSGGSASPLLVLVLAPLVIAFAALGRRRTTAALLAAVVLLVGLVAALGATGVLPWGPLPEPALGWARLIGFVGAVALAWTGVAGLSDAYVDAGKQLDALRLDAIEEAATRLRNLAQVSAKIAHELKNPLAAIKALVQLEYNAHADKEHSRSATRLGVVLDEIDRLHALVRDYLAFTRPASALVRTTFDARELLTEVAVLLSTRADDAVRVVPPAASAMTAAIPIVADRARLREAVFNLVDNAVRASPPGVAVELALEITPDAQRLSISDRGPGMAPHIAVALAAGDAAYLTTRADGSGLGLTIACAAVQQHGGRLLFAPREGGGTIATIELPL